MYADHKSILIPGKRGRILSLLYRPGIEGPCPAVLLCHGFPGNEQNLDLSQELRRRGFQVMSFHYSGSWGSDGDYSIPNCIEDADTVLQYMIDHAEELRIDPDRLSIIGHSLGGFVAAHLLAKRQELKYGVLISPGDMAEMYSVALEYHMEEDMLNFLDSGSKWLNGTTGEKLASEIIDHAEEYRFTSIANKLADKELLITSGSRDTTTAPEYNQKPLVDKLEELGGKKYRYITLETCHGYEDKRLELIELVASFVVEHELAK